MSGLSLMQTRNLIDRLGDLDEEVTRACKIGETVSKGAPKGHADDVSRLKAAMKAAQDCQVHVRMAKDNLLGFDGFLQAQRPSLRQALMHPNRGSKTAGFIDQVGRKVGPAMEHHVGGLAEEAVACIGRVQASLQALREAEDTDARGEDAKLSCKALEKTLTAAEKAIEKALKYSSTPEHGYEHMHASDDEDVTEEEVVEVKEATTHGYNLVVAPKSAGKMPPQFAENAQKKKDEAAGKKDDDDDGEKDACNKSAHGYDLTAGELPDFIKEKQKEREGEKGDDEEDDKKADKKAALPPEFLENAQKKKDEAAGKSDDEDDDKSDKKAGKMPPQFAENAQKKKDEAAGKKDDGEDDDKSDKKAATRRHGYDFERFVPEHGYSITADSLTPGNESKGPEEEGEEDQGYDPGHTTDEEGEPTPIVEKAAHGYHITAPSEHGYGLTT